MGVSTTAKQAKIDQCRKNAQAKSERKRQMPFAAIRELQQEKLPVTRTAVSRRAGVSVVFLQSHPDVLQAIEGAGQQYRLMLPESAGEKAKDQVIAALRRRLDEMKQQLTTKDQELREKQREIDRLYGKLAVGSHEADAELRSALVSALERRAPE